MGGAILKVSLLEKERLKGRKKLVENKSNALLYLEKNALTNKVAALETEIGFTFGQINKKTRTRRYRTLEKSLNENIDENKGLEDRLKAKENIILRLKERDLARRFEVDSSTKWYERNDNGEKESTDETSKSVTGEKDHEEVLTDITKMGEIKMESMENDIKKGMSSSSARIKLLRIRLNALANDHSSVCTEETRETHFSEI